MGRFTSQRFKTAKSIGNSFEQTLFNGAKIRGWTVVRIPDGCRRIGTSQLIQVPTPFDFIIAKQGRVIFLDTKTIKDSAFAYSMINPVQVHTLLGLENEGHLAGYLIYFRDCERISFIRASTLSNLRTRHSLGPDDGIDIGSIHEMKLDNIL